MTTYTIRAFTPADSAAMLAFAQSLPEHDLLFLGRDLRHPRVVAAWLDAIEEGWIDSVLAEDRLPRTAARSSEPRRSCAIRSAGAGMSARSGCSSRPSGAARGWAATCWKRLFAIAGRRGLTKLTAQMTPDQTGSIALFESLGFRAEALLKDHVRDGEGRFYDLAILSHDAGAAKVRRQAIGLE